MPTNLGYECIDHNSNLKLYDAGFETHKEVAFASPDDITDVLNVDDKVAVDIVDEAREHISLEGDFTTAADAEPSVDFMELDAPESVQGWDLFIRGYSRLGWESPAGYRLFIEGHRCRIWGSLPHEDPESPHIITTEQNLRSEVPSPADAVKWAVDWMGNRPIDPNANLDEYMGISDKKEEYFQIVHEVRSQRELYQLYLDETELVENIIASRWFDQFKDDLEEDWS